MKKSELKAIIRECIEEIEVDEARSYTPRQKQLKGIAKHKASEKDRIAKINSDSSYGKDPLTHGKNLYAHPGDPKRVNASTPTKKAFKDDVRAVKSSIKTARQDREEKDYNNNWRNKY